MSTITRSIAIAAAAALLFVSAADAAPPPRKGGGGAAPHAAPARAAPMARPAMARPSFARPAPAAPRSFARPNFARSSAGRPNFARPNFARPNVTRRDIAHFRGSRPSFGRSSAAIRSVPRGAFNRPAFRGNSRAARIQARRDARAAAIAARNGGNIRGVGNFNGNNFRGARNNGSAAFRHAAGAGAAIGAAFAARQVSRAGWYHNWRRHRAAYGWYGPVYWPYAYDSVFADVFYPYEDDSFWDYGYGDIYAGLFNPYGYDDLLTTQPPEGDRVYAAKPARGQSETTAALKQLQPVCGNDSRDVAGVPIDDIQNAVNPNDAQRTALDDLGNAAVKAAQIVKDSCPADIPLTATGRLEAMQQRIEAMISAVATVRTPMEKFYALLDDEQKARFNAIGDRNDTREEADRAKTNAPRSLAKSCGMTSATSWPEAQIERTVRPTDAQKDSLDALRKATDDAAAQLKSACPTDTPATPVERLAAISTRLDAMLTAVKQVRAPLDKFYGSLTDDQKARFNAIGKSRSARQQSEPG